MNIDNQLITADSAKRWIEMLQKQLIRENPSALPNDGIDGIYGAETTEWVTRFQQRKGLYVDGIAGAETLERLRTDIVFYVGGPSGKGVELLQEDLEYFYLSSGTIDGIYGVGTRQSVRDFQTDNNLFVDGEAGPGTLKKMDELIATILVQQGDTGSLVRRIQEQLNAQESVTLSIEVDGVYGSETESAVRLFQGANEQFVDGIVGPVTMNLLDLDAYHPATVEEMTAWLESKGRAISMTELSTNETTSLANILSSLSVFQENTPTSAGNLTSPTSAKFTQNYADGLVERFIVSANMDGVTSSVNMFASFDKNKEVLSFGFVVVDGDLYESPARLMVYDIDGERLMDEEGTLLDFTNVELDVQKEISKTLEEVSLSTSQQITPLFLDNLDACETPVSIGVGAACSAPFLLASSVGAGIAGLFIGSACSEVLGQPISDAVCN